MDLELELGKIVALWFNQGQLYGLVDPGHGHYYQGLNHLVLGVCRSVRYEGLVHIN